MLVERLTLARPNAHHPNRNLLMRPIGYCFFECTKRDPISANVTDGWQVNEAVLANLENAVTEPRIMRRVHKNSVQGFERIINLRETWRKKNTNRSDEAPHLLPSVAILSLQK
jgi:hypothetical protein